MLVVAAKIVFVCLYIERGEMCEVGISAAMQGEDEESTKGYDNIINN